MNESERVSPEWVARTAAQLQWTPEARRRGLELVCQPPNLPQWRKFLDSLLLASGSLALLSGAIFFIAANWRGVGPLSKFLLIDTAIILCALGALRTGLDRPGGRWALTVAAGLVGGFLALYGQTYQTGADPYELFLAWGALILPWCLRAQHAPLWALWIVIANCAFGQALPNGHSDGVVAGWAGLFNLSLAALARLGHPRLGRLEVPWTIGLVFANLGGLSSVLHFGWGNESNLAGTALWLLFVIPSALYFYSERGLAELAGLGFGIIVVDTSWIGCNVSWNGFDALLFLGFVVIVQVSLLAAGLRALRRQS